MASRKLVLSTALAPIIWGSTYLVTTEYLPQGYPLTLSMLRALPIGLLLLLVCRELPKTAMLWKILVLGALNFSIFWWLLFVSAYNLPGGVAATVGAIQPLIVVFLASLLLASKIRWVALVSAILGIFGVALLLLNSSFELNQIGLLAGIGGAMSMAAGTVLSKKWFAVSSTEGVDPLTMTAWQLVAGGVLLLPAALLFEPALGPLTQENLLGFVYLGSIGAGLAYFLWFRGLAKLSPSAISPLGFLSPVTAVLLGWIVLDQSLTWLQMFGFAVVLLSVWLSQLKGAMTTQTSTSAKNPDLDLTGNDVVTVVR
jgi:probable blue pigment (indigoidine) exporter